MKPRHYLLMILFALLATVSLAVEWPPHYVRSITFGARDTTSTARMESDASGNAVLAAGHLLLTDNTLGSLVLGVDGASTAQKSLRLNTGVSGRYLSIYANPDGGLGFFTPTGGGTFTFNMGWRVDFRTAEDACLTASRYVDVKDRDNGDAVRARFDTATGAATINGNLTTTGTLTAAGLVLPTSAPTSPVAGSVYYDTSVSILYIYDGAEWDTISGI